MKLSIQMALIVTVGINDTELNDTQHYYREPFMLRAILFSATVLIVMLSITCDYSFSDRECPNSTPVVPEEVNPAKQLWIRKRQAGAKSFDAGWKGNKPLGRYVARPLDRISVGQC